MLLIYILLWICFYNYFLLFVAFIIIFYCFVFPIISNSEFWIESFLIVFRIFYMERLILLSVLRCGCWEFSGWSIFQLRTRNECFDEYDIGFSSFYISYWTWLEIHCGTTTRFSFPGEDAMGIRIVWSFVFLLFSSCFVIDL